MFIFFSLLYFTFLHTEEMRSYCLSMGFVHVILRIRSRQLKTGHHWLASIKPYGRPGLEVIKLDFILRLKIKRKDWLLWTRVSKQPIVALYFVSETVGESLNAGWVVCDVPVAMEDPETSQGFFQHFWEKAPG